MKPDTPDHNGVLDSDITEALRRMRDGACGHEPYGPAVYGVALMVMKERKDKEAGREA